MPKYDVDKFADKLPSDVPLGSSESRRLLREMAIQLITLAEEDRATPAVSKPPKKKKAKHTLDPDIANGKITRERFDNEAHRVTTITM